MSKPRKKAIEVLLPPAVGYSLSILLRFFVKNRIPLRYYPRLLAIGLINLINLPFRAYERGLINPRFKKSSLHKEPVFIIGHWRSGTTHLHNLLCQDKQMGFLTTYQGVFPDTLFNFAGKFIFRNFTRFLIPSTRKGDNVTLDTENPQEEEFAVGARISLSYYYFWMFPQKAEKYYREALYYEETNQKKIRRWQEEYRLLMIKSLRYTGRDRFLSKNPPNTGRIPQLLEMFPNARFIFIHRNPVLVYLSTTHFFNVMMPYLQLQSFADEEREQLVLETYDRLMKDYLKDKHLIPEGNRVEVSFDELEQKPLETLKRIYSTLHISGYPEAEEGFTGYLNKMKSYQKNRHSIHRSKLNAILDRWDFAMKEWQYDLPDNIEILEDK